MEHGCENLARYRPKQRDGHYESFFQRANHPQRPLAFWIRYTLFRPRDSSNAEGELWCVYFDGEKRQHRCAFRAYPDRDFEFARDRFSVRVAESHLGPGQLQGSIEQQVAWDLTFRSREEPLFLLAPELYEKKFPAAKALVGHPLSVFDGTLRMFGDEVPIEGWVGSQNHNWGRKHTDHYAWGQVAGFEESPDTFLEVSSARLRIGPVWTPMFTPLVLRHGGTEYAIRGLLQSAKSRGRFDYFEWTFEAKDSQAHIAGRISAPRDAFVALPYRNPKGGLKCCLNSKIAECALTIRTQASGWRSETLHSSHRAAFEILTDDFDGHGVPLERAL